MSTITEYLSVIGLSPRIAQAIFYAELEPTSNRIQEVVNAYLENGQTPPAKLLGHLIQINRERYPHDPYIDVPEIVETAAPWGLAILGVVIILALRRKRK